MPLPKTASIAARATEVYSETWAVLLQKCWGVPPVKDDDLADIFQLLPYLRQLLTCCACAGLLEDAMISIVCGHCYCYQCQFKTPLLKIQCRQCRERRGLVIETQIRLLVDCYKRMCHILSSELVQNPQVLETNGEGPGNQVEQIGDDKDNDKVKSGDNVSDSKAEENKTATSASFNPITEILKEIEEGIKVSRAVLVVKPPLKYVNAKVAPTPKKEASLAAKAATSLPVDKAEKEKELDTESPLEVGTSAPSVGNGGEETVKKKRGRKAKRQLVMPSVTEEEMEVQESSSKEKERKNEKKKQDSPSVPPVKSSTFVSGSDLMKAKRAIEKLKPYQLEISVKSLDNKLVKVSADSVIVKDGGVATKGVEPISHVSPGMFSYVRFMLDKDGCRKRIWDPLCPRVVVKRSRASIDKMRNLQTRSIGARLRTKKRKRKDPPTPAAAAASTESPSKKTSILTSQEFEGVFEQGGAEEKREEEEMDPHRRLRELEREHGLQLPDLDIGDPDLELDASWLQELCEGIEEDFMMFAQPPIPGPPPSMPFPHPAACSTPPQHQPPPMFGGPPYSPHHHLPPPHFSPHHHHHHPPPFMLHPPPPPPHHHPPHPFLPPTPRQPLPPPPRHHHRAPHPPPRGPPPTNHPPPIRIHPPTSPRGGHGQMFPPYRPKPQLPVIVGKMNIGKSTSHPPKSLLSPNKLTKSKKRRSPGYSESGWRCRCGTNNVMFPEKVCAKGKCPCYSKGIACKNCLCRNCHNPFNTEAEEEVGEEMDRTNESNQTDQPAAELCKSSDHS